MTDIDKMDSAAINRELALISYALFTTMLIILSLHYYLAMFKEFRLGRITAIECSKRLNFVVPIKTFMHMHCSIMLLIYGHPELFFLNIRMMIWHWKLLSEGYLPNHIEQPERVAQYKAKIWRQIYFLWMTIAIYAYCLNVVGDLKVAELHKQHMGKNL